MGYYVVSNVHCEFGEIDNIGKENIGKIRDFRKKMFVFGNTFVHFAQW